MANPRQRRKAKSGTHRPVSHSKNAKRNLKKTPPIRGPNVLQDAWDKQKTVRQNYAALGLVNTLSPFASGGSERLEASLGTLPDTSMDLTTPIASTSTSNQTSTDASLIPKGHGRIVRDESGNVIAVQLADEENDGRGSEVEADIDMESLEPKVPEGIKEKWVTGLGGQRGHPAQDGSVVEALERISARTVVGGTTLSASITGVGARHASTGERQYLQRLVDKYGPDDSAISAMTRDRKLNPEQRTEGQLRRALARAGLLQ